jgi:hypothetical protein
MLNTGICQEVSSDLFSFYEPGMPVERRVVAYMHGYERHNGGTEKW